MILVVEEEKNLRLSVGPALNSLPLVLFFFLRTSSCQWHTHSSMNLVTRNPTSESELVLARATQQTLANKSRSQTISFLLVDVVVLPASPFT